MPDLPHEIVEEILVRLPAISLIRFSLVCKQWRYLISDPNFVRKHLNHVSLDRSNNHHHKLIVNSFPYFFSIDYESHSSTKHDFPLQSSRSIRIMASCNGLLLVGLFNRYSYRHSLVLWNPLLGGDYNSLPECTSISGCVRLLGFGYDSSTDDYKVVRLITDSGRYEPINSLEHRVEIYSLKTNSWKSIQGVPFGNVYLRYGVDGGTLVNGSIYWLVTNADDEDEGFYDLILAFDFVDETFRLLGTPPDKYIDNESEWSLVDVRGGLGLYQSEYNLRDAKIWILKEDENKNECWSKLMRIPIWILKEYENKNGGWSWSKLMRIPKDYRMYIQPAFFMKNDKVLLSVTHDKLWNKDKKLVVYDSTNMKFGDLRASGTSVWSEEMIYVETIVSPNGGRGSLK